MSWLSLMCVCMFSAEHRAKPEANAQQIKAKLDLFYSALGPQWSESSKLNLTSQPSPERFRSEAALAPSNMLRSEQTPCPQVNTHSWNVSIWPNHK